MPTIRIKERGKGLSFIRDKLNNNEVNKGLAKSFTGYLRRAAKERILINEEDDGLVASIHFKKLPGPRVYGVFANNYFWAVNNGRSKGLMPPDIPKIRNWASQAKGFDGPRGAYKLRARIGREGTTGKHFYETAKSRFMVRRNTIIKNILKK